MGDNGKLETQKEKAQEQLMDSAARNIPNKGLLPSEKTKDQIEAEKKPLAPPTEFKVAEIWIRNGRIMIDAPQEFWNDKARARGLLLYCDDIVREAKMEQPKIIPAKGNFLNGIRNAFKRK